MKKLLCTLVLALATGVASLLAEESYTEIVLAVRGLVGVTGSVTLTNSYPDPWRLYSVGYQFGDATTTNDFTINHIITLETVTYADVITTNLFNEVVTNAHGTLTASTTVFTNVAYSLSTTNEQYILKDEYDFKDGWYIMPGDVLVFSWSATTNFPYYIYGGK